MSATPDRLKTEPGLPLVPANPQGWTLDDLADDLRPRMAALAADGRPFVLVTAYAADGGPRGVGAQMVITATERWGFVSGGCIEADVAVHARATLADGTPRHLVYGQGSPWIDLALPCGGRLDLLAERIEPGDTAIEAFVAAYFERHAVRYQTDGGRRRCAADAGAASGEWVVDLAYAPPQRLIVFGSDPIALAIAGLGARLEWSSVLIAPDTPEAAMAELRPDAWTAIAIATHDLEWDEGAILAALASPASYIGVLGARRRIADRLARLRARGVSETDIARLHMPIGLALGARAPWEIAVSVTAQIIGERRSGTSSA